MNDLPAVDLLENTHTFPGPYMFKVIGRAEQDFPARTLAVVRAELALEADPPYSLRETPAGRHVAVTLQPTVQSAQQVLAVYARLRELGGLVMLW